MPCGHGLVGHSLSNDGLVLVIEGSVPFDSAGISVYNIHRPKGDMLVLWSTKVNRWLEFVPIEALEEEL